MSTRGRDWRYVRVAYSSKPRRIGAQSRLAALLHQSKDRVDRWRCHVDEAPDLLDGDDECIDLQGSASFEILQHRHFVAGDSTGCVQSPRHLNLETSMAGKWVELLKEVVPSVTRFAIPFNPTSAREFAKAGGLMSYGNDIGDNFRRSATFVDQILKGEKPSDIPVQFPVKFGGCYIFRSQPQGVCAAKYYCVLEFSVAPRPPGGENPPA